MLLVFKASSMKRTYFIELKSFKSFDIKVPRFYFASMPLFAHKPLLQSAGKPLNAQYCTWARSHRGRHDNWAYILHAYDVHQHSTFNRSRAAILLWGIDIGSRPSTKLSRI